MNNPFHTLDRPSLLNSDASPSSALDAQAIGFGASFDPHFERHANDNLGTATPSSSDTSRTPLVGGTYIPDEALKLLNSWFFLADVGNAYPIAQINYDGSIRYISPADFKVKLANLFVTVTDGQGGRKKISAERFWLQHPDRDERRIDFDPSAPSGAQVPGRFNQWRGFAVEPRRVSGRQRRLLRHILEVICRNDRMKFKYLLFWLAWAVQNPEKNPETVVVLKSAHQGTGKSTICRVMSAIFGEHARTIADKRRLFDRFNADLETAVFVEADEMLWAGDRSTADALKSMITSNTLTLEVKHGARWIVPNRFHMIMTTNHEHAVQAGVQDRRFFVLDVSAHKAQDECWFIPLYDDLENGGVEEFLWLLKRIKLAGWHPRKLPKTTEAVQQQRYSADSISDWAQACIDADIIVGALGNMALNQPIASNTLYEAYKGYCKNHPESNVVFGKAMTEMFGSPTRQQTHSSTGSNSTSKRPRTYRIPDADAWQAALDRRLGITS